MKNVLAYYSDLTIKYVLVKPIFQDLFWRTGWQIIHLLIQLEPFFTNPCLQRHSYEPLLLMQSVLGGQLNWLDWHSSTSMTQYWKKITQKILPYSYNPWKEITRSQIPGKLVTNGIVGLNSEKQDGGVLFHYPQFHSSKLVTSLSFDRDIIRIVKEIQAVCQPTTAQSSVALPTVATHTSSRTTVRL